MVYKKAVIWQTINFAQIKRAGTSGGFGNNIKVTVFLLKRNCGGRRKCALFQSSGFRIGGSHVSEAAVKCLGGTVALL